MKPKLRNAVLKECQKCFIVCESLKLRRWCYCHSDPKRNARNTLTLPLMMEAYPQWLHSRLRFTATAVFHAAYMSYPSKTKGLLCSNAGWNPPSAITVHLPETSCGAEQVRLFKGGQRSVKAAYANHSFHQGNVLYCMSASQTRCFVHEANLTASGCSASSEGTDYTHLVRANGEMDDGLLYFAGRILRQKLKNSVTPNVLSSVCSSWKIWWKNNWLKGNLMFLRF